MLGLGINISKYKPLGRSLIPIDDIPNKVLGLSLRQLISTYNGPVIRVRRSSDNVEVDFTPSEITDGTMETWVGTSVGDHGHVVKWYNQFGVSTYDFTQPNFFRVPWIMYDGTLAYTSEGDLGIRLEGRDEYWINFNFKNQNFAGADWEHAVFFVGKLDSPPYFVNTNQILGYPDGLNPSRYDVRFENNNSIVFIAGFDSGDSSIDNNANSGTGYAFDADHQLLTFNHDSTNTKHIIRYNGTQIAVDTDAPVPRGNSTYTVLGAWSNTSTASSKFYDGWMQEIMMFNSDMTDYIEDIEYNINKHYDIY